MGLARRLAALASTLYVILLAARAQQEVVDADRRSDGQAAPAGEGLPLSPDPAAPAVAIGAEHGIRNAEMLALGRARPTRWWHSVSSNNAATSAAQPRGVK